MSTKYTPGPWRLDETDPGTFEVLGPTNGFCADIIVSGYFWNPDDARLIAAAPELVEALREQTKWLMIALAVIDRSKIVWPGAEDASKAQQAARKILARIEGDEA